MTTDPQTDGASSLNDLGQTRVDLGEDLIEKTAMLVQPGVDPDAPPPLPDEDKTGPVTVDRVQFVVPEGATTEDLLASVKILMGEGLTQDAKKILHYVLIKDPGNISARKSLTEIQDIELKKILSMGEEVRRPYGKKLELAVEEADVDELVLDLDRDLSLGLFAPPPEASAGELSLFQDTNEVRQFCDRLEETMSDATIENWIDLGIGFLEMDLHPIAARLFGGAARRVDPFSTEAHDQMISAISLLALALILQNRPFEAISKMQPVLRDVEILPERKIELFYLMARIYEVLKKYELSRGYYQQVLELDPNYRDAGYRLAKKRV